MFKQKLERTKWIMMLIAGITVVLLIAAAMSFYDKIPEYATFMENRNEEQFIHDIKEGTAIEQEFISDHDFQFLTLEFSDHDMRIEGKTWFVVREKESQEVVVNEEIENFDIHYAQPVRLYPEGGGKKKVSYIITIEALEAEDVALGLFGYRTEGEGISCTINGVATDYAVGIGTHVETNCYKIHFWLVISVLIVLITLCVCYAEFGKARIEGLFLCIAIPIGIIFISFLNVNTVHDGGTHLTNIYKYANAVTGKGAQDAYGVIGLYPGEIELRGETDNFYVLLEKMQQQADYESDMELYYEERATNTDNILEYLPGVLGVVLGRLIHLNSMNTILLAKCFSFTFYVLLCYLAIKTTPFLKQGFAVAALLPMNLYQAAGLTYDAVIAPVAYLIFALILKARQQSLNRKELGAIFLLSMILGSCKGGIYIPILLFMIFMHGAEKEGKRKKLAVCLTSWILAGGALILSFAKGFGDFFYSYDNVEAVVETAEAAENAVQVIIPKYNLGYFFTNPIEFIKLFFNAIMQRTDYYLGSMIGNRMAWTDLEINWVIIAAFIVILTWAIVWEESDTTVDIKWHERLFAVALLICELVGIHAIFLVETPIGGPYIMGVQGRYFLAFVPLVLFVFYGNSRKKTHTAGRREMCILAVVQVMYMLNFMQIAYNIV